MTTANQTNYRAALYRTHQQGGANFIPFGEGVIVSDYGDSNKEKEQVKKLSLADLTSVDRIGFKGADTPDWLEKQKVELPSQPNKAVQLADGSIVARLSSNEFFVLGDLKNQAQTCANLRKNWEFKEDYLCYLLHRNHSHTHFVLSGEYAEEVMPKICGVNLKAPDFDFLDVAQTSVARLSAVVVKNKLSDGTTAFHILFDSSMAEYMWMCLEDAIAEFEGQPVGIQALE
jgi:sarcosine oxidase subunit gamma